MPNNHETRSRGKRSPPERNDNLADDDDSEDLNFRPASWPRQRRSRKNPTDLQIFKMRLRRQIPVGSDGKKLKVSKREILDKLFSPQPKNRTPQEALALIELAEELNPSPNPTIADLLDLGQLDFPFGLED